MKKVPTREFRLSFSSPPQLTRADVSKQLLFNRFPIGNSQAFELRRLKNVGSNTFSSPVGLNNLKLSSVVVSDRRNQIFAHLAIQHSHRPFHLKANQHFSRMMHVLFAFFPSRRQLSTINHKTISATVFFMTLFMNE